MNTSQDEYLMELHRTLWQRQRRSLIDVIDEVPSCVLVTPSLDPGRRHEGRLSRKRTMDTPERNATKRQRRDRIQYDQQDLWAPPSSNSVCSSSIKSEGIRDRVVKPNNTTPPKTRPRSPESESTSSSCSVVGILETPDDDAGMLLDEAIDDAAFDQAVQPNSDSLLKDGNVFELLSDLECSLDVGLNLEDKLMSPFNEQVCYGMVGASELLVRSCDTDAPTDREPGGDT